MEEKIKLLSILFLNSSRQTDKTSSKDENSISFISRNFNIKNEIPSFIDKNISYHNCYINNNPISDTNHDNEDISDLSSDHLNEIIVGNDLIEIILLEDLDKNDIFPFSIKNKLKEYQDIINISSKESRKQGFNKSVQKFTFKPRNLKEFLKNRSLSSNVLYNENNKINFSSIQNPKILYSQLNSDKDLIEMECKNLKLNESNNKGKLNINLCTELNNWLTDNYKNFNSNFSENNFDYDIENNLNNNNNSNNNSYFLSQESAYKRPEFLSKYIYLLHLLF